MLLNFEMYYVYTLQNGPTTPRRLPCRFELWPQCNVISRYFRTGRLP